jgi:competence protein ComEA
MFHHFRILKRQDQATILAVMVLALTLLMGLRAWDGLVGRKIVNYEAAEHAPIRFRIRLNEARWPELSQLPGIGETLARRIVESREQNGDFLSIEDLRRVQGVGRGTLTRIQGYLEI